ASPGELLEIPEIPLDRKADVLDLTDRLIRARAVYVLGDYDEGLELAEAALLEARGTEYPPLVVSALLTVGEIHQRLGNAEQAANAYYEASFVAERARLDHLVADARSRLIYVVGFDLGRTDEGVRIAEGARAALDRIGGNDEILARTYDHLAAITID